MRQIPEDQVRNRMRAENPWWDGQGIRDDYARMKRRAYFVRFKKLVTQTDVNRAVVLMGPRRVGKTVLLHHVIQSLLEGDQYEPRMIAYVSLDQPLYTRLSIEEVAHQLRLASTASSLPRMLFLDEIQYLADWARHLKVFVDTHPGVRCVVSGSAAAALRLKSVESGAGRFTDFLLPPLAFHEYLDLKNQAGLIESIPASDASYFAYDHQAVEALNTHFVDYINFGGYPEAAVSSTIQSDIGRYIGSDIVEKVLLRDLPSLYGIQDVQELNALFMTLTFNSGNEVSLEGLSKTSGVTKPTLKRYLEYLEAAFLIKVVHRIDHTARRFKRASRFKVYVTTPALHCALFGPVTESDDSMGALAETAVFAQFFHASMDLFYARWPRGEVDIVHLDKRQRPVWCVDVKWSDRPESRPEELTSLEEFAARHDDMNVLVTTRTVSQAGGLHPKLKRLTLMPTSIYCCCVGLSVTRNNTDAILHGQQLSDTTLRH